MQDVHSTATKALPWSPGPLPPGNEQKPFAREHFAFACEQKGFPREHFAFARQQKGFPREHFAFARQQKRFPREHFAFARQQKRFPREHLLLLVSKSDFPVSICFCPSAKRFPREHLLLLVSKSDFLVSILLLLVRRGGVARQLNRSWRAGVVSSAKSRACRSSIEASPYRARASCHPVCAVSVASRYFFMAQPPLLCEEGNAS